MSFAARVRELVTDEGMTPTEARAHVLAFEPEHAPKARAATKPHGNDADVTARRACYVCRVLFQPKERRTLEIGGSRFTCTPCARKTRA